MGPSTMRCSSASVTGPSPWWLPMSTVTASRISSRPANSRNVSVLLGTGGGAFGPEQRFAVGVIPRAAVVADLTATVSRTSFMGSGDVSVLFGNGDGTFQSQQTFAVDFPLGVTVADVNGDDAPDLV